MEYLPAILMGLTGNLHCLGMCGPLLLALPNKSPTRIGSLIDSLIYNTGRILVYCSLGFIIGILGTPAFITNYQGDISIIIGAILLIYIFIPSKMKSKFLSIPVSDRINLSFRNGYKILAGINSRYRLFLLGGLNGLLPCGLVYFALIASATMFDPFKSGMFMLIFGLGTFPVMMTVIILKRVININIRSKIRRLIPVGIGLVGLLLVVRGLGLGIPYLSPSYNTEIRTDSVKCH